jgi:hypothetical protein
MCVEPHCCHAPGQWRLSRSWAGHVRGLSQPCPKLLICRAAARRRPQTEISEAKCWSSMCLSLFGVLGCLSLSG